MKNGLMYGLNLVLFNQFKLIAMNILKINNKSIKLLLITCFIIFYYTAASQGKGAIGFTHKIISLPDSTFDVGVIYVTSLTELVTNGPAYQAKFYEFGKPIVFINGVNVVKQISSISSEEYSKYISSMFSCKPGDIVKIGVTEDYAHSLKDINNAIKNNRIKTYSITAADRIDVELLWSKMYHSWIQDYYEKDTYMGDNNPDKLLSFDNKNFRKAFAENISDIIIVNQIAEDKSRHHVSAREVSKSELHKKRYTIKEKWGEDPKTAFSFVSSDDYKHTAMIVLNTSADSETKRYSSEESREVARYVDQSGRSITEYRPVRTTDSQTTYEVSVTIDVYIAYKPQSGNVIFYKVPSKYFSKYSNYRYKFEELIKTALKVIPSKINKK